MSEPFNEPGFVKAARVSDFKGQAMKAITLLTRRVGIFRQADGSFRAMEMTCKHQGADLSKGTLEGDMVTCPRHGWRYDLTTGQCVNNDSLPLRPHEVRVVGDQIYVSLTPVSQ